VRCFFKYNPGQRRYEAISRFLKTHPSPFLVPTTYLKQGIFVNGHWYPITKMLWVQGRTLGTFIEHNVTKRQAISNLLTRFQNLVRRLESLGIAHGDLQHGNIIVSNGTLVLVDYDGMYVPELDGSEVKERGHKNYQHPARDQEFGSYLDRFSSIVIYLALKALTLVPNLWDKYSTGENLLFRQKDFLLPDKSRLLADLEAIPVLQPLIPRFRSICRTDLIRVPRLADFISGQMAAVLPESRIAPTQWEQYVVIPAERRQRLLEIVGQRVTVVGKITDYRLGQTKHNKPYVFLSFGNWRQGDFRLVIWSEAMQLFQSKGKNLQSYEGRWVSVTGLLTEYQKGSWPKRPQVIVEMPSEIEVLSGKEEVEHRISGGTGSWPPNSKTSPPPRPRKLAENHFDRGVAHAQQGRWDDAIHEYHAALTGLDAADKHYTTGLICWLQGQSDRAIQEHRTALKIKPNDADLHFNLGLLLCTQHGLSDEVIREWKLAAQSGFEPSRDLLTASNVRPPRKSSKNQSALAQEHFNVSSQ